MIEFMNWFAEKGYIRYISNGDVKYYSPNERKFHLGFKVHTKYYTVEELVKKYETDRQTKKFDINLLESYYTDYDNYCRCLHEGEVYVEWLSKPEFMERVKTHDDLILIHKSIGYND